MLRSSAPNERENKMREEDLVLGVEGQRVVGRDCVFETLCITLHREALTSWAC